MQEIRFIKIPAPIAVTLKHPIDPTQNRQESFTFSRFCEERTADPMFGKTLSDVLAALAIRQSLIGASVGNVIGLELDKWDLLCKATREPTSGYNPEVMLQLVPFARAILDATTTNPRPAQIVEVTLEQAERRAAPLA